MSEVGFGRNHPLLTGAIASTALAAAANLSGCSFPDHLDAEEALIKLDGKSNPCSSEADSRYKPRACDVMMAQPELALLYPEGADIDPKPVKVLLQDFVTLVTNGESDLKVKIFPVSGELGKAMDSDECLPDRDGLDVGESVAIQAAIQNEKINNSDFVMALATSESCDYDSGGVTYYGVGARFSEVYKFTNLKDGKYQPEHFGYRSVVHELGHLLGLGHSYGIGSKDIKEYPAIRKGSLYMDLDAAVKDGYKPYPYDDPNSVMGGGNVTLHRPNTAINLLTPMERDAFDDTYRIDMGWIPAQGKATLPVNSEGKYAAIDYQQHYRIESENRDEPYEYSVYGLNLYSETDETGESTLQIYGEAYLPDEDVGFEAQVRLGFLTIADGETVQILLTGAKENRRALAVTRLGDSYHMEVSKLD